MPQPSQPNLELMCIIETILLHLYTLIYIFFIPFSRIIPLIRSYILIPALLILCIIFLFTTQHSDPYVITGFTTVL